MFLIMNRDSGHLLGSRDCASFSPTIFAEEKMAIEKIEELLRKNVGGTYAMFSLEATFRAKMDVEVQRA